MTMSEPATKTASSSSPPIQQPSPSSSALVKAVTFMAVANSLHFGAYELARSSILALFTSETFGFADSSTAVTLAMGLVSPFCMFVLWGHRQIFDRYGPRNAVWVTTLVYAGCLAMVFILPSLLMMMQYYFHTPIQQQQHSKRASQTLILFMFVAKNALVQLLSAQHWSFLTSVLAHEDMIKYNDNKKRDDSPTTTKTANGHRMIAHWTPIVVGMASIAATACGWLISPLLGWLSRSQYCPLDDDEGATTTDSGCGLRGLLLLSSAIMLIAMLCSDTAYRIAQVNNFAPTTYPTKRRTNAPSSHDAAANGESLWKRSRGLFQRIPTLGVLCTEVLVYQSLSSFLSYLFVSSTRQVWKNDQERARYTGVIYARINLGSGILQFVVLPLFLDRLRKDLRSYLWLVMPCIMGVSSLYWVWMARGETSFNTAQVAILTNAFCLTKILEYSLRTALIEMVYGSLDDDDESRFLGKEVIGLTANRMGKSGMAVVLAAVSAVPGFENTAPLLLSMFSSIWMGFSLRLVRLLQGTSKQKTTETSL